MNHRTRKIDVGDQVTDRLLSLTWTVVDFTDDGTIYIERNGVRAFTARRNVRRAPIVAVVRGAFGTNGCMPIPSST